VWHNGLRRRSPRIPGADILVDGAGPGFEIAVVYVANDAGAVLPPLIGFGIDVLRRELRL
jgi:hypothetical protein